MAQFQNILAVINPAARSGRLGELVPEIKRVLEANFGQVEIVLTKEKRHAARIAREASEEYDLILAGGGDGTVHEVASGLVDARKSLPMGVLPLGSGNDFGRALKLSSGWKKAVSELAEGKVIRVDSGKATWLEDAQIRESFFINALGIGFDAHSAIIAPQYKAWPFSLGYTISILAALKSWVSAGATIWNREKGDELLFSGRLMFVTVGNAHDSGGGYTVNPGALISDGMLDPCIVEDISFWKAISLLPRVRGGGHISMKEVTYLRTEAIFIETDRGLPIHADGEVVSKQARSIRVSVNAGSLNVVVPASVNQQI